MDEWLSQQIEGFASSLCQQGTIKSGKLTLEFFERRKGRWLLPAETVNWEVWHLELCVTEPQSEQGMTVPLTKEREGVGVMGREVSE